ncbi:manganese efflux pump MntP [Risungbinella massiliensis]|uniref:manganese efflux pump MntP n=1 Tax=Risungbinella massiliensis TaxID=1329796 RepID=UPI0005CB940C|nr:manganese efflux pump [Risungbinella massiliensis]
MQLSTPELGQIVTLAFIAIALGMDAFSIGIGIGTKRLNWQRNLLFAIMVGIFHVVMPFFGFLVGRSIGGWLEGIAVMVGGGMLCLLGAQMVYKNIKGEEAELQVKSMTWFGLFLFSLSVSVDSLSVGLTLGLFQVDLLLAIMMFGLAGFILSGIGLSIGRILGSLVGGYGEVIGGIILIALGVKFIW